MVVKAVGESGGYGMLIGPHSTAAAARRVPAPHSGRSAQLHRAAHAGAFLRSLPDRRRRGIAPHRSAAVHSVWRKSHHRSRRPDARGAAQGIAGGELLARRRQQRHLGAARRNPEHVVEDVRTRAGSVLAGMARARLPGKDGAAHEACAQFLFQRFSERRACFPESQTASIG